MSCRSRHLALSPITDTELEVTRRDGGGTVGASDPLSEHPDWPESREWFAHSRCEGGAECFVEDSKALHAGVQRGQSLRENNCGTRSVVVA
eukprot:2085363-Rhodomonas_salina.1